MDMESSSILRKEALDSRGNRGHSGVLGPGGPGFCQLWRFGAEALGWTVATELTLEDVWPVIAKLPPPERQALTARLNEEAAAGYAIKPIEPGEFDLGADVLSWEAEGWEDFDHASR